MTLPRPRLALGLLILLAPLAGCGRHVALGHRTYGANDLVIQVTVGGGMEPINLHYTELPLFSLYGDGRAIMPGPAPATYPGPALPDVRVWQLTNAQVNRLVDIAIEDGLGDERDYGSPEVYDAPSTSFTVLDDPATGRTLTANANALGMTAGLSRSQRSARDDLDNYYDALTNLANTFGQDAVGAAKPYAPTSIAAVAQPLGASPGTTLPPASSDLAWPGPDLPGAPPHNGSGVGCVVLTGDAATQVLTMAAHATTESLWSSAGQRWLVGFRPLFPDEAGCDDIG